MYPKKLLKVRIKSLLWSSLFVHALTLHQAQKRVQYTYFPPVRRCFVNFKTSKSRFQSLREQSRPVFSRFLSAIETIILKVHHRFSFFQQIQQVQTYLGRHEKDS